MDVNL